MPSVISTKGFMTTAYFFMTEKSLSDGIRSPFLTQVMQYILVAAAQALFVPCNRPSSILLLHPVLNYAVCDEDFVAFLL